MNSEEATKKVLEIEKNPEKLEGITSTEAEELARNVRCPCLIGKKEGTEYIETCRLTGQRVDGDCCESFPVISCPDLMTLVSDSKGEIARGYNQKSVPEATRFYRGLMWVSDRRE